MPNSINNNTHIMETFASNKRELALQANGLEHLKNIHRLQPHNDRKESTPEVLYVMADGGMRPHKQVLGQR